MGYDQRDWERPYGGGMTGISMEEGRWAGGAARAEQRTIESAGRRNKLVLLEVNKEDPAARGADGGPAGSGV